MAVLKRGDLADRWQLAASRKFAASFALAIKLWVKHFGAFLRLMWLPCLLSAVVALAWLWLRPSSVLWGVSMGCIVADFLGGATLLFVWSMMRTMQLKALDDMEIGTKVEPMGFVRNFVAIAERTWRPYLPLLAAWLVTVLLWRVPIFLGVHFYVQLACIVVALVLHASGIPAQPPLLGRHGCAVGNLAVDNCSYGSSVALWPSHTAICLCQPRCSGGSGRRDIGPCFCGVAANRCVCCGGMAAEFCAECMVTAAAGAY